MKKFISLTLCVLLLISIFTGCSSKPDATNGSGDSNSYSSDTNNKKITIMTVDQNGNPMSGDGVDEVYKLIKEHTGYDIDINFVTKGTAYKEKLGVTLMGTDMPMILTSTGAVDATIVQAANAGAFWDLSDYIFDAEKYPNLSQMNPAVYDQVTVNDQIIGVYRARALGRFGLGYRKDWADALGLPKPETMDDIYNMAKAFREQDPDGNGVKDTYGIGFYSATTNIDITQTWLGVGNGWVETENGLIPIHQTQEYIDSLNWLRKLYEEDAIPPDWAVRDKDVAYDAIRNGESGIFVNVLDDVRLINDYFIDNKIPSVTGDGYAHMELVGPLANKKGDDPRILSTPGMLGFLAITKAAKTEEDLEACLTFLDKMCDDEMLTLARYGLQDHPSGWSLDDEGLAIINTPDMPISKRPHSGLDMIIPRLPNLNPSYPQLKLTENQQEEERVMEENLPYTVSNPASKYLNNSNTYSTNGANLDSILKDARVQYICMQIDESGLQAAFENWEKQGGTKVIEEVNAQIKK